MHMMHGVIAKLFIKRMMSLHTLIPLDTVVITTIPKPDFTTSTQDITAPSGVDLFRLLALKH